MSERTHHPVGDAIGHLAEATDDLAPVAVWPIALVAVALIALSAVFMGVDGLNAQTFVAVQGVTQAVPDWFWANVTNLGTGIVAFAWLSPSLAWQPRWFAAAIACSAFAGLYSNLLKRAFALPRPASVLDPDHLHVIGQTLHANSFPSGHSVTAFTLAAVLVLASRRPLRTACWAVPAATLVAFSRIAVGAHWPADLAAGAAGGWIAGAVGVILAARWRFWNTPNGVRVMGVIAIGIGIAVLLVDLGYPLGIATQWLAGGVAIVAGAWTIARPRVDRLLPRRP